MTVASQHAGRPGLAPVFTKLPQLLPPGRLGRYILFVSVIGTLCLGYAVAQVPTSQFQLLLALFILSFLAEWTPINLRGTPLQGSNLSMSAAMTFAAALLVGPAGAILVNMGCALAYTLKERRPLFKRVLTTAALANASAAAGLTYMAAGGALPLFFEGPSLLAAGLAAGAYFLVNSVLVSGAISLATQRPFRSVLASWQWLFLQMLTSLAVGLVMALAYTSGLNTLGFLVSSMLLVLPWFSTHFYVQKSRQVSAQQDQLQQVNRELVQANSALDLRIAGLRTLHNIGVSLNSAHHLPDIFDQILKSVSTLTGSDAAAIFLLDDSQENLSVAGQIGLSAAYRANPETALNGSNIRALRENQILIVDPDHNTPAMFSEAAMREGIRAAVCLPLGVAGKVVGDLEVCFKSAHRLSTDELDLLGALAQQAAVAIQNAQLVETVHEGYLSTIQALAATVDAKDPYTRGHSEAVRQLAAATGRQIGLSQAELELLGISALFHDIGKIGVPEAILNKPDRLNAEEWKTMAQHPLIGESILSKVPALSQVSNIVRHHHERYDGGGYPDGVEGRDVLLASVIAVCDAYQAMTSDRPYRKAMSHAAALAELQRGSGTQFVPEVVVAFIAALDHGQPGRPGGEPVSMDLRSGVNGSLELLGSGALSEGR